MTDIRYPTWRLGWRAACLLGLLWAVLIPDSAWAQTRLAAPGNRTGALADVRSWGYQLQNLNVKALAASPYDVLVIDYSRDGSGEGALTAGELVQLKTKPDGTQRRVLAYLSIGEAETYRYYWKWTWGGRWYTEWIGWLLAPSWLGAHNDEWGGNYAVRYWDERWQSIILGDDGYLDRILAAGFDGVYLDKIDSSVERIAKGRKTALDDMRAFVARIAGRGRAARPGFLVVPQNGEELLADAAYRALIDGLGKEDLFFGDPKDKVANSPATVARRTAQLKPLLEDGKTVLAVEYLDQPGEIAATRKRLTELGVVPHFADRELDSLRIGDIPSGSGARRPKSRSSWRGQ